MVSAILFLAVLSDWACVWRGGSIACRAGDRDVRPGADPRPRGVAGLFGTGL